MRIDEEMIVTGGRLLVAGICVAGAAFLAYADKPGWGWMLVVACLFGMLHFEADE